MLFGNNDESVFVDKTVVNTKYRTVLLLSDIFVLWGYEPRRGLEESETNKPPAMRVRIER